MRYRNVKSKQMMGRGRGVPDVRRNSFCSRGIVAMLDALSETPMHRPEHTHERRDARALVTRAPSPSPHTFAIVRALGCFSSRISGRLFVAAHVKIFCRQSTRVARESSGSSASGAAPSDEVYACITPIVAATSQCLFDSTFATSPSTSSPMAASTSAWTCETFSAADA